MLSDIPAITSGVRVLSGTGAAHVGHIETFLREAAGSGSHVWGEIFRSGNASVENALEAVSRRGGLTILGDHGEALPALARRLGTDGVNIAGYGARHLDAAATAPFVDHAKGWATSSEMLFSTASPHGNGVGQINLSMRLGGAQARAFVDSVAATAHGSDATRHAALGAAKARGVVFNDPELGVRHLDDAMGAVIDGSQRNLQVVIKEFLEPAWARRIVAAKARGVDVKVVTRQIDDASYALLRGADVPVKPIRLAAPPGVWRGEIADRITWRRLHFNAVSADDRERVVVGTRYFWEPSKPGDRIARELGVVLGGDPATQVGAAIDQTITGRATLRDLGSIITGRT